MTTISPVSSATQSTAAASTTAAVTNTLSYDDFLNRC